MKISKRLFNKKIKTQFLFIVLILISARLFAQNHAYMEKYVDLLNKYNNSKDINIADDGKFNYIGCTLINPTVIHITKVDFSTITPNPIWSINYSKLGDTPLRLFRITNFNNTEIAVLAKSQSNILLIFIDKSDGTVKRTFEYSSIYTYPPPFNNYELKNLSGIDLVTCNFDEGKAQKPSNVNSTQTEFAASKIVIVGSVHNTENVVVSEVKISFAFKVDAFSGNIIWSKQYSSALYPDFAQGGIVFENLSDFDSFNDVEENISNGNLVLTGISNKMVPDPNPNLLNHYTNNLMSTMAIIDQSNGKLISNYNDIGLIGIQSIINSNGNIVTIYTDNSDIGAMYVIERDGVIGTVLNAKKFSTKLWTETILKHFDPYTILQDDEFYYIAGYNRDINDLSGALSIAKRVGTVFIIKINKSDLSFVESYLRQLYGTGYIEDENYLPADIYHREISECPSCAKLSNYFYYPTIATIVESFVTTIGRDLHPNNNVLLETLRIRKDFEAIEYIGCIEKLLVNEDEFTFDSEIALNSFNLSVIFNRINLNANSIGLFHEPNCETINTTNPNNNNNIILEDIEGIVIYPNPTSGTFKIQNGFISKIELSNSFGELIEIKNILSKTETVELDLTNYVKGIYYLKLFKNNGNVEYKMILKK